VCLALFRLERTRLVPVFLPVTWVPELGATVSSIRANICDNNYAEMRTFGNPSQPSAYPVVKQLAEALGVKFSSDR